MNDKEKACWAALREYLASQTGPYELERNWDVQERINDLIGDEDEPPYRGGWFTAETPHYHAKTMRWRDPKTGKVWRDDDMNQACASFDEYYNVQWEDDEPAKTPEEDCGRSYTEDEIFRALSQSFFMTPKGYAYQERVRDKLMLELRAMKEKV